MSMLALLLTLLAVGYLPAQAPTAPVQPQAHESRVGADYKGPDFPPYLRKRRITAPRAIYSPDPEYPKAARKAKLQGNVVLVLVVNAEGRPRDIQVVRPLGMGLDENAVEAVSKWKFTPATINGKPVAVKINVMVDFRL